MVACPSCGFQMPPDAKFCSQCGTKMNPPETTLVMPTLDDQTLTDELSTEDIRAIESLPAGSALLIVEKGPGTGQRFLLRDDQAIAGRHPKSDIFLDDVTVSRKHAIFTRDQGSFHVEDAGSLNGTYVNRILLREPVLLRNGDEVQIGKYKMVFFLGSAGGRLMPTQWLSIGKVQEALRPEFGEVKVSKIRFLESKGLVTPERAPSGFRRYTKTDVERLRYILNAQRDNFLPLKVIKQNLDLIDQGIEPTAPEPVEPPKGSHVEPEPSLGGGRPQMRLTREELLQQSGLSEASLVELERQWIIRMRRGTNYYGWEAFTLAVVVSKLAPWGIDARQMRVIKAAADREIDLIQNAVGPYIHRPEQARRATYEIAEFMMQAHAALLQTGLDYS